MRALRGHANGIREEGELLPPLEAAAPLRAHRAPPVRVGHQQEPPVAGRVRQLREAAERAAPTPALGGRERHGRSIHPRCGRRKFSARHFLSLPVDVAGAGVDEAALSPPEEVEDEDEEDEALSPPSFLSPEPESFLPLDDP
jgi:hypothetical protein